MKIRPDLVPETEQNNLEVIQLTDESVPSSHIYMEAQIFTPDSQRLILHRSAHPHGSDPTDPEHQFLICNLEDHCNLTPITTELGTTGPSISPDGEWLYYFVNETEPGGGQANAQARQNGRNRTRHHLCPGPRDSGHRFQIEPTVSPLDNLIRRQAHRDLGIPRRRQNRRRTLGTSRL